jgi:pyruvate,water dikinase
MILPLGSQDAHVYNTGGKGASLAKLALAGFPVPDGFLITTDAYQAYLQANQLGDKLKKQLDETRHDDPSKLDSASQRIRAWFSDGVIPPALRADILKAYISIGAGPVAVRSSATAEDLPEMSFAGQQDTFLNVIGEQALLKAVVDCWSSLWTGRAIGYRNRNGIPHDDVALAIVVQLMAPAQASGVMFTANPLNGARSQIVIDATLGLGEALVAGLVEPDHYVVEKTGSHIIERSLGAKAIRIQPDNSGGVTYEELDASVQQALPDEQIIALAEMGARIESFYGYPQDIEWSYADGKLYLLQSRPITSLFPIPEGLTPDPLHVFFSFASVQGIVEPITPLGQDTIRMIFAGGASLFGFDLTYETQRLIFMAGERLWVNFTGAFRHPIGSKTLPTAFSAIDPAVKLHLEGLKEDPKLGAGTGRLRFSTLKCLLGFIIPTIRGAIPCVHSPEGRVLEIQERGQTEIERLRLKVETPMQDNPTLEEALDVHAEIFNAFPFAVPNFGRGIAVGLFPLILLNRISKHLTGSGDLALEVTRGLPNNVTTEMDLALWQVAYTIRSDGDSNQHFQDTPSDQLAVEFHNRTLPTVSQGAISGFLERYGMRGIGEIDIGRLRWREEPTHIMQVLKGYMKIEDPSMAPDSVFEKGAAEAEEAIAELETAARATFAGALKARLIRALARRVRALAGLRESPKFHIIQMMGIIRAALLESGRVLVSEGVIRQEDDLFYLYINELKSLAAGEERDWSGLITQRRDNYESELRRVQIPRLLLSDGRTFYEGLGVKEEGGSAIFGSPVSPGVVEGHVRVVLDPSNAELAPGEILVCPGTDPAWTPLFLSAGGLVMEVGGVVTHGAIVAREYGIPAVVGVHQATSRLRTGQRIQVNGSTGDIIIIDQQKDQHTPDSPE